MKRTILITGGAGFIGSNFVKYWYKKYPEDRILVLDSLTYAGNPDNIPLEIRNDNERFEFWYGNVCNGNLVDTLVAQSNIIVHFAAESHVARSIYDNKVFFETDVIGTQTIASSVVKYYKNIDRLVHISTSEVYGTSEYEPMDEKHPLNPCSPYAAAKCGADRLIYSFMKTYDLPAVIVRPFNQYGPNQHLEKVVPRFITSALKDEPLTIHGNGIARRDWLYVDDTCERIDKVIHAPLEKVQGEVFNLGSGEVYSVIDIANLILEILGKPASLLTYIGDRLGQVDNHVSSTEKASSILGIKPGRSFRIGLEQTINWYAENESWWQRIAWMKHIRIVTKAGKVEMH
jgi:dTDP-glucose 4,6-dehydratase